MFEPGQTIVYKGNEYIVVLLPSGFKIKTSSGWVPGYMYVDMRGNGYAREQSDMEKKFRPKR